MTGSLNHWLDRLLGTASALLLLALMGLTCVDVVGRYVLGAPVPGSLELTELLLAALIFTALPLVSASGEHVTVDLLDHWLPPAVQRLQQRIASALGALACGVLAWQLGVKARVLAEAGETSSALQFPMSALAAGMAAMLAVTALVLLVMAWRPAADVVKTQV